MYYVQRGRECRRIQSGMLTLTGRQKCLSIFLSLLILCSISWSYCFKHKWENPGKSWNSSQLMAFIDLRPFHGYRLAKTWNKGGIWGAPKALMVFMLVKNTKTRASSDVINKPQTETGHLVRFRFTFEGSFNTGWFRFFTWVLCITLSSCGQHKLVLCVNWNSSSKQVKMHSLWILFRIIIA